MRTVFKNILFFWAHFELKDCFFANLSFKTNILSNEEKGGKFEYIWKLGFKKGYF